MSWTLYTQTAPIPGQGFGPSDLILVAWPQTATTGAIIQPMTTQDMIDYQVRNNPPSYWQHVDSSLPSYSAPSTAASAQETYLQAQISAVSTAGGNPALLQAILASVQTAAAKVGP